MFSRVLAINHLSLCVFLPVVVDVFTFVCVWERGSYGQIKEVCVCCVVGKHVCSNGID